MRKRKNNFLTNVLQIFSSKIKRISLQYTFPCHSLKIFYIFCQIKWFNIFKLIQHNKSFFLNEHRKYCLIHLFKNYNYFVEILFYYVAPFNHHTTLKILFESDLNIKFSLLRILQFLSDLKKCKIKDVWLCVS